MHGVGIPDVEQSTNESGDSIGYNMDLFDSLVENLRKSRLIIIYASRDFILARESDAPILTGSAHHFVGRHDNEQPKEYPIRKTNLELCADIFR